MPTVPAERHPAAVARAIEAAWQRGRWRAYALGLLAGFLAGGIAAPIATSTLTLALGLAGLASASTFPAWEFVWSATFVLAASWFGARAYARSQPVRFRRAAQAYLWLAQRAERNWSSSFGERPVPRDPATIRAFLDHMQPTADTAGERYGLWIAILEIDRAREAIAQMPDRTPNDRFMRASAEWLVTFTGGTTLPIEPLEASAALIEDPSERLEAAATLAVTRARAAIADGTDWETPLAAVWPSLDGIDDQRYDGYVSRPVFRRLLTATLTGVVVFWMARLAIAPYFSFGRG